MSNYEERFYIEFSQLVKTMKEISSDLKEIKNQLSPCTIPSKTESSNLNTSSYTYGEICKMKEDFEKTQEWLQQCSRHTEERNDK